MSRIEIDGLDPRSFLASLMERRSRGAKKAAKARLVGSSRLDDITAAYAVSNSEINRSLRLGLARVAIDDSCHPTDVSIRRDGRKTDHLPANLLDDDVYELIVAEAAKQAGIKLEAA